MQEIVLSVSPVVPIWYGTLQVHSLTHPAGSLLCRYRENVGYSYPTYIPN
jgi:hypothetical protein